MNDVAKQKKASAKVHGEKKAIAVNTLFTKTTVDSMDKRSAQLGLSRGEYQERVMRWIEEHWDSQLERDLGWEDKGDE